MMYFTESDAFPIGRIILASDGEHLTGLWLEGQKYGMESYREEWIPSGNLDVFDRTRDWLERYFSREKPTPSQLPLAPSGTQFRRKVWKILCEIPWGEVTTYGAIAQRISREEGLERMSAQAVGNAVGHNPISIIIPCHRVVGSTGKLTGYAGGIDKKAWLLSLEGISVSQKEQRVEYWKK